MGMSIAISELDSNEALCRKMKNTIIKVYLPSIKGFENYADYDEVVDVETAKRIFGNDWNAFAKRNRIAEETGEIYLSKIRNADDSSRLHQSVVKRYTGWIEVAKIPENMRESVLAQASPDNKITEWDMLGFDELNETCSKCPLSWDSGRGCIGTFGPDNSALPDIARKYNCSIIADVPKYAKEGRKLGKEEIIRLLDEISILREKLVAEGKMAVRRYAGVLDRLEAAGKTALRYNTRMYFV
ncbi:MAG: hypothetical protein QXN93_04950 [Methanomassiliicoccales archaeon]